MPTSFSIVSKVTGLAINFGNSAAGTEAVLWTASANDAWEEWQFLMSFPAAGLQPFGFCKVINAQTGNQFYATTQTNSKLDEGLTNPVVETSVGGAAAQWTVRPPSPGSASYGKTNGAGLPYFELLWSSLTSESYTVLNVPDHLLKTTPSGLGVPLQVSPGNGGQDNEIFTFANTASPAPALTYQVVAGSTTGTFGQRIVNFKVTGYSGSKVNVVCLGLPNTGDGGFLQTGLVSGSGGVFSASITIDMIAGDDSPYPLKTLMVLDENDYAIAFGTITFGYWSAAYII
jgi:hypothetical protein